MGGDITLHCFLLDLQPELHICYFSAADRLFCERVDPGLTQGQRLLAVRRFYADRELHHSQNVSPQLARDQTLTWSAWTALWIAGPALFELRVLRWMAAADVIIFVVAHAAFSCGSLAMRSAATSSNVRPFPTSTASTLN